MSFCGSKLTTLPCVARLWCVKGCFGRDRRLGAPEELGAFDTNCIEMGLMRLRRDKSNLYQSSDALSMADF
jgi:hypothetical protein